MNSKQFAWRIGVGAMGVAMAALATASAPAGEAQGLVQYETTFRAFGQAESNNWFGGRLTYGLNPHAQAYVAFDAAKIDTFTNNAVTIRKGGRDVEFGVRFQDGGALPLEYSLGLSLPNTPANDLPGITGSAAYRLSSGLGDLRLGARGLATDDTQVVGLFLGGEWQSNSGWSVPFEVTTLLEGNSGLRSRDGARERRLIYTAALCYRTARMDYELGITNRLGGTTGMSLSTSLDAKPGFYFGVNFR